MCQSASLSMHACQCQISPFLHPHECNLGIWHPYTRSNTHMVQMWLLCTLWLLFVATLILFFSAFLSNGFNINLAILIYHPQYGHTYPLPVFDADISSFLDEAFHCVVTTIVSCNMQGGPLMERKQQILK